ALAKLSDAERTLVNGLILPGGWYPLAAWDRFLDAMRAEATARRGESEIVFDLRTMREAGGSISEGRCETVENVRGRALVRYVEGSPALLKTLSHHLPTAMVWVLEQSGAHDASPTITRRDVAGGKLVFEVSVTYRA